MTRIKAACRRRQTRAARADDAHIEVEAVVAAAAWCRVQSEFVTRGEAAIKRWKQEGGGHAVDEVMADLQARLDDAKRRAAQRAGR